MFIGYVFSARIKINRGNKNKNEIEQGEFRTGRLGDQWIITTRPVDTSLKINVF